MLNESEFEDSEGLYVSKLTETLKQIYTTFQTYFRD